MQWRQPPERVNRLHTEMVEFGRARRRGRGTLIRLDSSGPGVLLLAESPERTLGQAEHLALGGYTVLVPELDATSSEGAIQAAAEYLTENWHPRLGVMGVGAVGAEMVAVVVDDGPSVEAIALYDGIWSRDLVPGCPLVAHFDERSDLERVGAVLDALESEGLEAELCLHEGLADLTHADERTVELFDHHLS